MKRISIKNEHNNPVVKRNSYSLRNTYNSVCLNGVKVLIAGPVFEENSYKLCARRYVARLLKIITTPLAKIVASYQHWEGVDYNYHL